ncbi:putative outer membrane starch-binding protein [Gillisia sp. Hel_I_86]|uniref:RagB/SusD family nutrient uptake outer membrane protein n=1 Tax=Gillisia sp. Hel_I_86 TaxID=1249981 RepID=UPI00119C240B|nr:RagB/SusD family nutrient uptake outer membrane protein [Gillisia sp. Hel_I_86]TVZ26138.1 putative outer membrane starch-binding protein [Gillisia sp. Hel_I_86]
MKLKSISYLGAVLVGITFMLSCSKEYLEIKPQGFFLEDNYYGNADQAYTGVVAVYDILGKQAKTFDNMITFMNAGSDDFNAGGGGPSDGAGIQSFNNFTIDASTVPPSFWNDYFQGVFRANVLLQKLPEVSMDENLKARFAAEAKALRAFYNFQLIKLFKNIPLFTEPVSANDIYNVEQVEPEVVYAQIETDLLEAIADLPNTIADLDIDGGRLTKGAVQAILGKVYLYQGKNTLAAEQLADVNGTPGGTSMYGYKLLDNYGDLFGGDVGFNSEAILEVAATNEANVHWGNWGGGQNEGNTVNQMVGPRGYSRTEGSTAPDYAGGWSFNTVTQDLYDAMQGDPRFDTTIADLAALEAAGEITYTPANQDTGYFLKKFMPLKSDITTGGGEPVLNYAQNVYIIRLADTYLLEAEVLGGTGARAQALLDAVRARVDLPSIPVSLDAIARERRLELAGEGHRFFDLVRTGRAATVLQSRGFTAGKNEILPIPLNELENTLIVQNPGY